MIRDSLIETADYAPLVSEVFYGIFQYLGSNSPQWDVSLIEYRCKRTD